jgi:hypothetical protein
VNQKKKYLSNQMKKIMSLVALTLLSCFQLANAQSNAAALLINEIMARNIDMMLDPSYNYGGWIELYNPTNASISLNGLYISNDASNPRLVQLTSSHGSVPAKGFKTLWFDHYEQGNNGGWGGNTSSTLGSKQIDFKIRPEGDTLYISDKNGNILITQICPRAIARTSYARITDGGDEWSYTYTPTEGKSNVGSIFAEEQIDMPRVDRKGTIYSNPFDIHVDIPEGAMLRYTTDGTTPDLDNGSTSEDGVFNIGEQKNYVYRFRLYKDGYLPSDVATHTYIYNASNYYLPIVSVVTNPKNLYDDMIGCYVDGKNGTSDSGGYRFVHGKDGTSNKNRSWDRPVNFEYIVPDSASEYCVVLNQEVDFEVSGGWSRHFPPAPSFKLIADKVYGEDNFLPYPIFSQKPYIKNKAILVRNGGNDCDCRMVDAAIDEIILSSGFYLDCQAYQPSHVFINGKYQFMFNVRELNNKNFGYSNYGIDKDEMDQFEYGGGGYTQKAGDDAAFVKWTTLCNDLSSKPTDASIWSQICELCDIDEICNYFATELYVGSEDWITNNNNTKGFRDRNDGKFHFVFFDVDEAFYRTDLFSRFNANKSNQGGGWGGWGGWGGGGWFDNKSLTDLLSNLLTHQGFRKQFIDTYCIVAGSVFDSNRSTKIIRSMAAYTEAALALDGKDPWDSQGIHNLAGNDISGRALLNNITNKNKRAERIRVMQNFFSLPNGFDVTIKSNLSKAELLLNDVKIPTGKLEGTVFAPAVLTTDAPAGFTFKGWKVESGSTSSEKLVNEGIRELNLENVIKNTSTHYTITAQYEAISDSDIIANREEIAYAPIRINEVSAANDIYINEQYKKNDWFELYNATDMPIDVAGLYVSDNPNKPQKYQIPTGNPDQKTIIKPGGKLIIWADKLESMDAVFTTIPLNVVREGIWFSNLHSGFKIGNDDDNEVLITSSEEFIANNPEFCEAHPAFRYFADHLVYKAHKHDQTVGRYPDGGNNLYVMNRPTIGTTNSLHSYDVHIGVDDGLIIDDPTAIDAVLAENSQVSVSFSGSDLVIEGTASEAQLYIYTSLGQLQKSQKVSIGEGKTSISVGFLPAGIYVANIKSTNGQAASCKFIIR